MPYKSSVSALTDVGGAQLDLIFIDPVTATPFYQSQRVRPLAIAGDRRLKSLPDVPSAIEAGIPGYSMNVWFGLFVSANTPPAVLARVRESVAQALKSPATAALLEKRELEAMPLCGEELGRLRSEEIEFWRGVIRKAGIEPQ